MERKNFTILALATLAIVIGAAIAVTMRESSVSNQFAGRMFYPDLQAKINDISLLVVTKGDTVITVEQSDNGAWTVKEKQGYPANFGQIKEVILAMASFSFIEKKTNRPELYQKLGVEKPQEDSGSTRLTFKDKSGEVIVDTIIGNNRVSKSPGGRDALYVRNVDDKQAWLVQGKLNLRTEMTDWLRREIVNIENKRIKGVIITQVDGSKLRIEKEKSSDKDYQVINLPKGTEIKSTAEVNRLATSLVKLNFDDVVPLEGLDIDRAKVITAQYRTFDGLVIDTTSFKRDDKWYLKLDASFDEALLKNEGGAKSKQGVEGEKPADPDHAADPDDPDDGAEALEKPEKVLIEAQELAGRVDRWIYIIPTYKAQNLTKKLDDLIKKDK